MNTLVTRVRALAAPALLAFSLGLVAAPANAAVIYFDLVPDRVVDQLNFRLDFDGDGFPELMFSHDLGCVGNCRSWAGASAGNGGAVLSSTVGAFTGPTPLAAGAVIGPGSSQFDSGGTLAEDRFAGQPPVTFGEEGLWDDDTTAFIGFRFLLGGNTHYGWARVNVQEQTNIITVFDAGYEDTSDTGLRAGVVPEPGSLALLSLGVAVVLRRRTA